MLIVNNLCKSYGADVILNNLSFSVGEKDHMAIVGNNGVGKTTLLKCIAHKIDYDGEIELVAGFKKIGLLKQEIPEEYEEYTVYDFIEKGRGTVEIEKELNELYLKLGDLEEGKERNNLLDKIENLQNDFQALDGYNNQAILYKIAKGCGIDESLLDHKISELSGGQKSRIAFAQLLYSNPDVLLLDEPTNHLDPETKDWIIDYINSYKGAVLTVSHDEDFLRRVATKILMIDEKKRTGTVFSNTYDEFLKIIEARDEYLYKAFKNQMKKINQIETFIQSMAGKSNKQKRQAQSREKLLEKLKEQVVEVPQKVQQAKIDFESKKVLKRSPLTVSELSFSYDGKKDVFHNLSFSLYPKERFIVIGKNGAGKTTLFKVLNSLLLPRTGQINLWGNATIGYYAQEQEDIQLDSTVEEEAYSRNYTDKELRNLLAKFKFHGDKVKQIVRTLSPGERSRLALLKLCLKNPDIMLLDEPTNHLDIETKKTLAEAINNYNGTIMIVSHDLEFLKHFNVNRMLILPSGNIMNYNPDIVEKYYQEELLRLRNLRKK